VERESGRTTRRGLFVAILQGIVGLLLGIPAVAYLLKLPRRESASRWIPLASLDALRGPGPHRVVYAYEEDQGYRRRRVTKAAFVLLGELEPLVLSPICTHMGCNVSWDEPSGEYHCPCHGGRYDRTGRVLAGPPPRPLDRLPVRLTGRDLEIRLG
jgi:Rieske Fe-S protein